MSKITESQLTKLYYSIGEVAKMFNVNTSLIRFWEKEFPMIKPKKNKKGNRLFTPKEVMKINTIYTFVKVKGYTLDGAKKAIKSKEPLDLETADNSVDNTNQEAIIKKLTEIKKRLLELKSN